MDFKYISYVICESCTEEVSQRGIFETLIMYIKEVKHEIEITQVSISDGTTNNVQLTEVIKVIDELQRNRKLKTEIKETNPPKNSGAQPKTGPKVSYVS